ncbi:MAG: tagaturonate reductase [Flavitalea sp.]
MEKLSLKTIDRFKDIPGFSIPDQKITTLPEKALQFGTGVLLRGLPDYFIDLANKQGLFNGRIVVVKSTSSGGTDDFNMQDGLYTQCIRGLDNNNKIEENIINASISRVLSAKDEWDEILLCAANENLSVVISNTTEVGIQLDKADRIDDAPPSSFPGKLLAALYARYKAFNGDLQKGLVIIPTELIVDNGEKLKSILVELAAINMLPNAFIDWIRSANHFCSSLVDRIVPGKLPAEEKTAFEIRYNYSDNLIINSESYCLWAIEANDPKVNEILSFSKAHSGVVIAPDITHFRELKLRLLNGSHTFSCGLAHIAGFTIVKEALDDQNLKDFITRLMKQEIAPAITNKDLSIEDARDFSSKVIDRFRNPFIEHKWLSITVQYSSKMKMRNIPTLLKHYEKSSGVPGCMALGFAAYILFMRCTEKDGVFTGSINGKQYIIQDDHASWYAEKQGLSGKELVKVVLSDTSYWGSDLSLLPGFSEAVINDYGRLEKGNVIETIKEKLANR